MILSCSNIDKTFIDNHVIKNASFHIEDYEKAAIVGINGAGKSTLLKIITGQLSADDGLVTFAKDKSFGYLAQHQAVDSENTIFDELLTVKQEVLDLEASIRQTEADMKSVSGDELELLLKKYTSHQRLRLQKRNYWHLKRSWLWRRGFWQKGRHALRWSEDPRGTGKTPAAKA